MSDGGLGTTYADGEIIARQGDAGDCMYVIQEGQVAVMLESDGVETLLRTAEVGEFLGEMAIFDREVRSATLRAAGEVREVVGCGRSAANLERAVELGVVDA